MNKPAIEGGKSVRKDFLVFGKPKITKREVNELLDTIHSGWIGTGPKTKKFEEDFRRYTGAKHAIALNSCTAGLHLALDVLGIQQGDEVITTPLTFASTANVIIHHHATPVFADVEKDSWNIDPNEIEKKISKRTRAIIPVDLHGRPCNYTEIKRIARKYKLNIIEDAAHAAEGIYKGKHIGSIADMTAFSFYVTKNIMTVEGGMLTTNKKKWAEEAQIRSLHGISHDAWKRYSSEGYKPYETLYPGYKYNMTDIQASFGLHQLADVEKNARIRKNYWNMYTNAFKSLPQLILPAPVGKNIRHAHHLYAILIKPELLKINRDQFVNAMNAENIGTGVHFTPLHVHKYYRETFGYKPDDFPNAEFVGSRTISLPLSPTLSKKDINDVIAAVTNISTYYKK